jgi:hypothetical protein
MKIQGWGAVAQPYTANGPNLTKQVSRSLEPANRSTESTQDRASVRAIDFSSMTQNDMQGVAQHLYETGEIDLTQMGMLQLAGPLGKCGPSGEFIPFTSGERAQIANTPTNYIKLVQGAVEGIESRGGAADPKSGYADWKHILSVIEKTHDALPSVDAKA